MSIQEHYPGQMNGPTDRAIHRFLERRQQQQQQRLARGAKSLAPFYQSPTLLKLIDCGRAVALGDLR